MPPRDVLMSTASRFISASRSAPTRLRVVSCSGTCRLTTSAAANSASSASGVTACCAHNGSPALMAGSCATTRMPSACASVATSRPMPPKPTRPRHLPPISRPSDSFARGHLPAATSVPATYAPRSSSIAVHTTYSATASALAPVAAITSMLRARQAATSMLSSPTPRRPTTASRGAASSSAAFTSVRLRTISASAGATATRNSAGWSTSAGAYSTSNAVRSESTAVPSMNSAMTMRCMLSGRVRSASGLHPPTAHGALLDHAEDQVLDDEADDDHRQQAGEHVGDLQRVLVLVDVPAEAARSGADAEHQLGCDQRAPLGD